jgi:DNA-binding NarL/FixJ family response regulator
MRAFWEKLGVLGPIYRLVSRGVSDADIASKLNLTEPNVQSCIAWTLHFLRLTDRNELVRHAFAAAPTI